MIVLGNARDKLGLLSLVLFILMAIGFTGFYIWYNHQTAVEFDVPKLLAVRVGGVPVPALAADPVQVVPGEPVLVECEVVPLPEEAGTAVFRFEGPDGTREETSCAHEVTFDAPVGSTHTIAIDFLARQANGAEKVIERREAAVEVIELTESVRLHRFTTPVGEVLTTNTVPREVLPHLSATLELDGPAKDFVALFFVRDWPKGQPVLQIVVPPDEPDKYYALALPLKEYRTWGGKLKRYVAWPEEKGEVLRVGNPDSQRQIFEVFSGVFRAKDVPDILKKAMTFQRLSEDKVVFNLGSLTMDDLRQLAYHNILSEPIRLVRAEQGAAESSVADSPHVEVEAVP